MKGVDVSGGRIRKGGGHLSNLFFSGYLMGGEGGEYLMGTLKNIKIFKFLCPQKWIFFKATWCTSLEALLFSQGKLIIVY